MWDYSHFLLKFHINGSYKMHQIRLHTLSLPPHPMILLFDIENYFRRLITLAVLLQKSSCVVFQGISKLLRATVSDRTSPVANIISVLDVSFHKESTCTCRVYVPRKRGHRSAKPAVSARRGPCSLQLEQSLHSREDPAQPKRKINTNLKITIE